MTETNKPSKIVLPYQFQPIRGSDSESEEDDGWSTVEEETDEEEEVGLLMGREVDKETNWCECGHCQQMPTSIECVCCKERDVTKEIVLELNLDCIISHPSFEAVCLNKDTLWMSMVQWEKQSNKKLPPFDKVPNNMYRYQAYRNFTKWMHRYLGDSVRRVIPSCAICRIRAEFKEEDGNYTSFKGADTEASEITSAFKTVL